MLFFTNPHFRNILFPFVIGILAILAGSIATGFLVVAAIIVIFFNAEASFVKILQASRQALSDFPILWALPLFYLWLGITAFIANDTISATQMMISYWQIPIIIPFSVGLYFLSPSINLLGIFTRGLRLALCLALLLAAFQLYIKGARPDGFTGNELVFSSVCAISAGLSLAIWNEDGSTFKQLAILSYICGVIIVAISFSRGMLLTVVFQTFVAFVYIYKTKLSFGRQTKTTTIAAVLLLFSIGILSYNSSSFHRILNLRLITPIENLLNNKSADNSTSQRVEMLQIGFHAFKENPILGYGIQNVMEAGNFASQAAIGKETTYSYTHLHNDYLTHAVGGGLPLLILFISVISAPIFVARKFRGQSPSKLTLVYFSISLSVGYLVTALTNITLRHDILTTLFATSFAFILVGAFQNKHLDKNTDIPDFGPIFLGKIKNKLN